MTQGMYPYTTLNLEEYQRKWRWVKCPYCNKCWKVDIPGPMCPYCDTYCLTLLPKILDKR